MATRVSPLLIATRNAHKTREFAKILGPDLVISDLADRADCPVLAETGSTFEENATLKAVAISRIAPGLVVADDSGLEVVALGGAPGIYSARYAGEGVSDAENIEKLISQLSVVEERAARFCCVLALAREGKAIATFRGEVVGVIADRPRGNGGFGYDPVFVPAGFDRTFAELGEEAKNRISHRALAIQKLRQKLSMM